MNTNLNTLQLAVRTFKGRDSAFGPLITEIEPDFGHAKHDGFPAHLPRVITGIDEDGYPTYREDCWCYI